MNTPKERQQWIFEQLVNNGALSFSDCFIVYSVKFSKTQRTFAKDWNIASVKHTELCRAKEIAVNEVIVGEAVQAAQNGLKTKYDRVLNLQHQVDEIIKELAAGTTIDTRITGEGKAIQVERKMTANELATTRRSLKELQAEISKIEGDYAAFKMTVEDVTDSHIIALPPNNRGNE